MRRALAAMLLVVSAAAVASAQASEPELAWRALDEKPAVHKDLVDCRSPVVAHERVVKLGEEWALEKATLAFERKGAGLRITVKRPDPAKPETIDLKGADPALVTLDAFGSPYGLSVRLDPDNEHVRVASAFGLKVSMGRDAAFLVDSDLDGTLGSAGDGLVAPGSRTVGPLTTPRAEIWSAGSALAVRKDADGSWSVATLAMPRPEDPDHSAAWRYLQWQREACGLLPVAYHPELEPAMRAHAEYLRLNKVMGHGETEGKPGYSAEGLDAGMTCVLGYELRSHLDGIRGQLLLLFHRTMCLSPDLSGSAMVLRDGTFLASVTKAVQSPQRGKVLAYPPHGMRDVPCEFGIGGEMPMPVAAPPSPNHLGTPVGIFAMGLYRAQSLAEKPTLKLVPLDAKGRAGSPVDAWFFHPGRVPDSPGVEKNYMGNVALVPKAFLKPDTRYRATVAATIPGRRGAPDGTFAYEWEFTTGKSARR